MNMLIAAKKFFSYFAFFNNEREIRKLKERAEINEKIYRQKINQQERKIYQLIKKIDYLT